MQIKYFLLGILLTIGCIPSMVFACTGGLEWIAESGMYITDITNDTPVITPGQTVHFDFELFNKSDPAYKLDDAVPYSIGQATLMRGSETMFVKDIPYSAERELAGFDYQFPEKNANYTLIVSYQKDGTEIASAQATFAVGSGDGWLAIGGISTFMVLMIIVGVAAGLTWFITRRSPVPRSA